MSKSSNLTMQNRHHKLNIDVNTCCWGWSIAKPKRTNNNNNNSSNRKSEGDETIFYNNNNGLVRSIIDTFDLIVHLKEIINSKADGFISDHLLDKAMLLPKKQQQQQHKS